MAARNIAIIRSPSNTSGLSCGAGKTNTARKTMIEQPTTTRARSRFSFVRLLLSDVMSFARE